MQRAPTIVFFAFLAWPVHANGPDCVVSGTIPEDSVFIGYTRASESTLKAFALLEGARLRRYDGNNLAPGTTLHRLLDASSATIEKIEPYLDRHGKDHCVYPATLLISPANSWEIWASRPDLRGTVRRPTPDEANRFREYESDCIFQGGPPPEGVKPVCVRPELVAVSDLDGDGMLEYWHTAPYTWDTGFRIAEEEQADGLVSMLSACPGCSD